MKVTWKLQWWFYVEERKLLDLYGLKDMFDKEQLSISRKMTGDKVKNS